VAKRLFGLPRGAVALAGFLSLGHLRIMRRLQTRISLVLAFLLAVPWMVLKPAPAQESHTILLMPMPAHVQPGEGRFTLDSSLSVDLRGSGDARVKRAVDRFLSRLSHQTGVTYGATPAATPNFVVNCRSGGETVQKLGEDESYRLEVGATGVSLDAPTPLGVIHGLQTLSQLVRESPEGFNAPAMTIEDGPRFPWRGLLIDVSRHFMPVEVIKRNLDGMEAVKFNVLHWHLSDDQGFRVESKKLPKLQRLSSDGQYYTQDQIKDVIAYARDRGIRVVPEFDVPGHTTSWFVAYPDLASGPGPYQISRHFGVHDAVMDPTRDHTFHVLDDFIGEMSRLFPDEYFHIGGDEVNGKQWEANPQIRKFSRRHGFANHVDLHAYFNERLEQIVKKHGKIMVGWDEILHAKLPKDVVVQSWRGQKSLAEAARQGYRGLLSFGYYLDLMHPAWQHYSVDPLNGAAASLSAEEKSRVLGGEACMWAELITADNIDERVWPRAAVIAERLWSPQELRDLDSMYARLGAASEYLQSIGLLHKKDYHTMLERLAAGDDVQPLRVLADVLEPVRDYTRNHTRLYETTTPLNRLVDAVRPENDAGRNFAAAAQRVVNKTISAEDLAAMRAQLSAWEGNDQRLKPMLQSHPLLQEVQPQSQNLSAAAAAGLQALDYLSANGRAPAAWRDRQLALLKEAQKPQAEMLLAIVPAVQTLVEATAPE
jgi:hexosaminidase